MTYRETFEAQIRRGSKRWLHTLGTSQEAGFLAVRWGCDPEIARVTGLLHDVTKEWPVTRHLNFLEKCDIVPPVAGGKDEPADVGSEERRNEKLLHAITGALWARQECGVSEEVVNAIRWHTTGRDGMSLLEKIVYLADKIEPGRRYRGVTALRRLAYENIDAAMCMALDASLRGLLDRGRYISPRTVQARNAFVGLVPKI